MTLTNKSNAQQQTNQQTNKQQQQQQQQQQSKQQQQQQQQQQHAHRAEQYLNSRHPELFSRMSTVTPGFNASEHD
jgi:transcription initiation factor TFIID subunit TAF12